MKYFDLCENGEKHTLVILNSVFILTFIITFEKALSLSLSLSLSRVRTLTALAESTSSYLSLFVWDA